METVIVDGKKQYKITENESFKSSADFADSLKGTSGVSTNTTSAEGMLSAGLFSTVTVTTKVMYGRILPEFVESIKMLGDSDVDFSCAFTVTFPYKITKTNLTNVDDYSVTFDCAKVAKKDIYVLTEKTNYEGLFKSLNNYNNALSHFYVNSANLSANNTVKVSWTASENATLYQVYYRQCGTKEYVPCDFTSGTTSTIYDFEAGKTYKIKITAENSEGKTLNTYTGYITTLKKNTLTTTSAKKSAKLSWKKDSAASGYQIYMKQGSSDYKLVKTITKPTTVKYTKGALTGGKKYTFKVRSYKTINNKKVYGAFSSAKTVTVKK